MELVKISTKTTDANIPMYSSINLTTTHCASTLIIPAITMRSLRQYISFLCLAILCRGVVGFLVVRTTTSPAPNPSLTSRYIDYLANKVFHFDYAISTLQEDVTNTKTTLNTLADEVVKMNVSMHKCRE
jgi:hypothetical protein